MACLVRMCVQYKDNMEARLKYPDQPERFLDSELDLDENVKALAQVASSPELFPVLIDGPTLGTLLAVVGHENVDIAADALDLLSDLTAPGAGPVGACCPAAHQGRGEGMGGEGRASRRVMRACPGETVAGLLKDFIPRVAWLQMWRTRSPRRRRRWWRRSWRRTRWTSSPRACVSQTHRRHAMRRHATRAHPILCCSRGSGQA